LNDFDGMIGLDLLMEIDANVDLSTNVIKFNGGVEPLKFGNVLTLIL